jgi:hypothetical protein
MDDRVGSFVAGLPHIEEIHAQSIQMRTSDLFGLANLGNLRVLHVEDAGEYDLAALARNAALGNLTHLALLASWVFRSESGPLIELAGLRALVRSKHLKALTHLALHRTDAGDRGVREIVRSGILARLVELDLQHGCITDDGARALAASPDYGHLRKLDIEDNRLGDDGILALEREGLELEAEWQQEPGPQGYDEGYLYFDDDLDDLYENDWE